MGKQTNIETIRALEKQIEEEEGDIIQLKRTRNSLLNISTRIPPEILGHIFFYTLVRQKCMMRLRGGGPHFDSIHPSSYNFLLVCHHWFEVASRAPRLWNFWGDTLSQWRWQHRHTSAVPVDLVYYGHADGPSDSLDTPLEDALRFRANRDGIRQVHLLSHHGSFLLSSIISTLTPDGEGIQCRSIESIDLRHIWDDVLDVSHFFARIHLPKLRSLILGGNLKIPSWDCLAPQTTLLKTLSVMILKQPPTPSPTMTQLLSILVSNPGLQHLTLSDSAIPKDDGDGSMFRAPLRQLKKLGLNGRLLHVLKLLGRLEFPDTFDELEMVASGSKDEEVVQVVPQLREYVRLACKIQGELEIARDFSQGFMICITAAREPRSVRLQLLLASADLNLEDLFDDLFNSLPQDRVLYSGRNVPCRTTGIEVIGTRRDDVTS